MAQQNSFIASNFFFFLIHLISYLKASTLIHRVFKEKKKLI